MNRSLLVLIIVSTVVTPLAGCIVEEHHDHEHEHWEHDHWEHDHP